MKFSWLLLFLVGLWQIKPINPNNDILKNPNVAALIDVENAEIFQSIPLYRYLVNDVNLCAAGNCVQHYVYDFAHNATVVAVVAEGQLIEAFRVENATPAFNARIEQMAQTLIANDVMVQEAVGKARNANEIVIMQMQHPSCPSDHLCVATTLLTDGGSVWILVDVTTEQIIDLWWGDVTGGSGAVNSGAVDREQVDCSPQVLARDGWSLEYRIAPSDGLAVADVYYNGTQVVNDVRLIQWEANYVNDGNYGYIDYTGCGAQGAGHGFPIEPDGVTQINDITGGFELRQNFEMVQWGDFCNYRYEQVYEFYADGRWRMIGLPYGRGCGDGRYKEATYRPIFRLDFALDGTDNDLFQSWDGSQWQSNNSEAYFLPTHSTNLDGRAFRILDGNGFGYEIEMGAGQFGDGGTGDGAYTYLTRYKMEEGAADMPTLGTCCNQDHQKGPNQYVNGESTGGEHLVLWYVPEALTQTKFAFEQGNADAPYCWTESTTEFYPCPMGPMFHPIPVRLAVGVSSAEIAPNYLPLVIIVFGLLIGFLWLKPQVKLRTAFKRTG